MNAKPKKILKTAGYVVGALLLLLILTGLFWLGPTVKLLVTTIGPKALGTDVRLEKLKISPIKGTISLKDFAIKNPDRFGRSNAVSLASLEVSVDMASLFSSTILVHRVEIDSPYFIYEQDRQRDNITEFIRNVQEFVNYDPDAPPKPKKTTEKDEEEKPGKVVLIEQLAIRDVQLNLANTQDHALDLGIGFESLAVSMTNGTVFLDNVYIRNPARLETPNLFTLDGLHVLMDPESIYSTNLHFKSIRILKPHAFIEHNPQTDTAGEFLKIAASLAEKIPTNAPQAAAAPPVEHAEADTGAEASAPPTQITLDLFEIDDLQLHAVNIGDPDLDVHLGMNHFTVELEKGAINLDRLYLTNPARLTTPDVFSIDRIAARLKPGSHREETLVIEDLQIIKTNAFLELNTNNNTVSEFLRLANGYIERIPAYTIPELPPAPEQPAPAQPAAASARKAPPFELQNLTVDDIDLYLLDTTDTNQPSATPRLLAGIDEVSARLSEGLLHIDNIRIPNAPGFTATNLFHLNRITVELEPDSLLSDQVVINTIHIDSPQADLEQTETSGNVASLQAILRQFAPPPADGAAPPTAEAKEPEAETPPVPIAEQPVVLHHLMVTNLNVRMKLPVNTNTTQTAGFGIKGLNPMGQIGKLNPLTATAEEDESDPDAPLTLAAFRNLSLEPLKGMLHINELRISNPPNFSRRDMVNVEHFSINLDPDTVQSDILRIQDIQLTNPRVRYERQILKDNIKAFKENIEQATLHRDEITASPEVDVEPADTPETEEDGQKVIIDRISINGCIVYAKLSALPTLPIPLPLPVLKDIGKEKGGATPAEAATQVYDTFYEEMISAVGSATGFAGDALKGFGGLTSDMMSGAKDGVGNITKGSKEAVKKTVEKTRSTLSKRRRAGGKPSAAH